MPDPITASVDPTTYEDAPILLPLIPTEAETGHRTGYAVAFSGDGRIAVVGVPFYEDANNVVTGCAIVYTYTIDTWVKTIRLTPTASFKGGQFGYAVAISADGSTIAIGARGERDLNGAVYVYVPVEGVWTQQTKLVAPTQAQAYRNHFGRALALSASGDRLAVGASRKNRLSGNVFVYTRTVGVWSTPVRVLDGTTFRPKFGRAVALSADGALLAVGNHGENANTGVVSVYRYRDTEWLVDATLAVENGVPGDRFGYSVALSADATVLVAGSYGTRGWTGAATVFRYATGVWTEEAELIGTECIGGDRFGRSVAVTHDGKTVLVGTSFDDTDRGVNSGSAYVFSDSETPGEWNEAALIVAGDGTVNDQFGHSVALNADGSAAVVGAFADGNERGSAYVINWTGVARE